MLGLQILASLVLSVAAPGDAARLAPRPLTDLEVLQGPEAAQVRITPLLGWGLDLHNNPSLSLGGRVVYSPARAFGVELFGARLRPGTPDEALFDLQPEEPQTASRTQMLSVVGASVRWRPDDDPALDDAVVHRVFLQAGASLFF